MPAHHPPIRDASDVHLLRCLGLGAQSARTALERAGSLRDLLALDTSSLRHLTGLDARTHRTLAAARELGRRDLAASLAPGTMLATRDQAKRYVLARTRDLPFETFGAIWLDAAQRVIACDELFRGTIDTAEVHPREIVRRALEVNATGALIAHNHVSGVPTPSPDDQRLTERLAKLLAAVRVQLFDHLIAGDGVVASFHELGILPTPEPDAFL